MITASNTVLKQIFPEHSFHEVDGSLWDKARMHLDSLTKPKGSLGRLEELAARLFSINQGCLPFSVEPCILFTVAADHGVACQGVSPFPQVVTRQMVENFLVGGAAINVLCRVTGIELKVIDAGCMGGPFKAHPLLLNKRMGNGTEDISVRAAMTEAVCINALRTGFEVAMAAFAEGYSCLGTGEMGIANSTSASALYCALLQMDADAVTGPGAGANGKMLQNKIAIVKKILATHASTIKQGNPLSILASIGGFEIAMLAGMMLACASARKPLLVDGFICTAAYVSAVALYPGLADYAILSHASAEPGYAGILQKIPGKPRPLLNLGMRLGEGTGCAAAYPLLRDAAAIYNDMATMDSAHVSATDSDRTD